MSDNLTNRERDILESFERGEWKSARDIEKRKEELMESARTTLRKDKRVNIRISERDLRELKRHAVHEGLPYQTLIASILHKFVNGVLRECTSESS